MLSGDNSILSRATDAKIKTEEKNQEEIIKIEVMGSIGTDGSIDVATLKTNLEKIGATATGNNLPLTVSLGEQEYTIATSGDVTKKGDVSSNSYGLSSDGTYFVGKKSIGKTENSIDNTQQDGWDENKNGYVFTTGHFIYVENYPYYSIDTDACEYNNVYLCWDKNEGVDVFTAGNGYILVQGTEFDIFNTSGELVAIHRGDNDYPFND